MGARTRPGGATVPVCVPTWDALFVDQHALEAFCHCDLQPAALLAHPRLPCSRAPRCEPSTYAPCTSPPPKAPLHCSRAASPRSASGLHIVPAALGAPHSSAWRLARSAWMRASRQEASGVVTAALSARTARRQNHGVGVGSPSSWPILMCETLSRR
ncbi:hypothetical protein B0H10DRAFT_2101389 [Mycena sp. CBHHK59/15]|nr:hypothetical protein B0H10DRAFT_2101389 [Mycena sp. CBHHK59/15]